MPLFAGFYDIEGPFDHKNEIKILQLIPKTWAEYPAINPAIPSDFEPRLIDEIQEAVLWGRSHDTQRVIDGKTSEIEFPVFLVRPCEWATQTGPNNFSVEKEFRKFKRSRKLYSCKQESRLWGQYPVLLLEMVKKKGQPSQKVALIGLHSPGGWCTEVTMLTPKNMDQHALSVWETFIEKTEQLPELEYIRALGSDLHIGVTNWRLGAIELKVLAERRKRDGFLAVNVLPLNAFSKFEVSNALLSYMGTSWCYGEKCIKLDGRASSPGADYHIISFTTLTAVIKDVDEISFEGNLLSEIKVYDETLVFALTIALHRLQQRQLPAAFFWDAGLSVVPALYNHLISQQRSEV